jgi:hypothetical protein
MFWHPIGPKTWSPGRWGLLAAGAVSVGIAAFLLYRNADQGILGSQWLTSAIAGAFGLALLIIASFARDRFIKRLNSFFDS